MKLEKLEKQINEVLNDWAYKPIISMIKDIAPIITLYAVESKEAIKLKKIDPSDQNNVRLIRTVYLLLKFAENHAGKLAMLKSKYPKLASEMEKYRTEIDEVYGIEEVEEKKPGWDFEILEA